MEFADSRMFWLLAHPLDGLIEPIKKGKIVIPGVGFIRTRDILKIPQVKQRLGNYKLLKWEAEEAGNGGYLKVTVYSDKEIIIEDWGIANAIVCMITVPIITKTNGTVYVPDVLEEWEEVGSVPLFNF